MQVTHDYGKYPRTGPNYDTWGEQPGLIYDYARDAYFVDKNQYEEVYKDQLPPEEQAESSSISDVVIPVAATAAAVEVGRNALGKEGYLKQGYDAIKDGVNSLTTETANQAGQQAGQQITNQSLMDAGYTNPDLLSSNPQNLPGQPSSISTGTSGSSTLPAAEVDAGGSNFAGDPTTSTTTTGGGSIDPVTGQQLGLSAGAGQGVSNLTAGDVLGMAGAAYGAYKSADYMGNASHSVGRAAYEGALSGLGMAGVTGIYGPLVGAYFGVMGSLMNDVERAYVPESILSSPALRQDFPELNEMTQEQQLATIAGLYDAGLLEGYKTNGDKRADLSSEWGREQIDKYAKARREGGYLFEGDNIPRGTTLDVNRRRDLEVGDLADSGSRERDLRIRDEHNAKSDAVYQRLVQAGYDVPMVKQHGSREQIPDIRRVLDSLSFRERLQLAPEFYGNYEKAPEVLSAIDQTIAANRQQGIAPEPPPAIDSGQRDEEGNPIMRQPTVGPGDRAYGLNFADLSEVEYSTQGGPPILNPEDLPEGARQQYVDTPEQAQQQQPQPNSGLIELQGDDSMNFKSRADMIAAYAPGSELRQPFGTMPGATSPQQGAERAFGPSLFNPGERPAIQRPQRLPGSAMDPGYVVDPGFDGVSPEQLEAWTESGAWEQYEPGKYRPAQEPGSEYQPWITQEGIRDTAYVPGRDGPMEGLPPQPIFGGRSWEELKEHATPYPDSNNWNVQQPAQQLDPNDPAYAYVQKLMQQGQPQPLQPQRSETLSPGIGLDGRPIGYGRY